MDPQDEIDFWSRQLSEHALFGNLMLAEPTLKKRAGDGHQKWEDFRRSSPARRSPQRASELALETRALLAEVLARLTAGEWLGSVWPLLADHMIREGDYFLTKLRGAPLAPQLETAFWLNHGGEEAAFTMAQLDPSEAAKIQQAMNFGSTFRQLYDRAGSEQVGPALLASSQEAGQALDSYLASLGIGTPVTKSIIHPVLAEHVTRENRRGLQTLAQLSAQLGQSPAVASSGWH